MPWKIKFLLENHDKLSVYISLVTIAEIVSEIRSWGEKNCIDITNLDIEDAIDYFKSIFQFEVLKNIEISSRIVDYVYLKIDIKDALHLETVKNNKMILVTDDNSFWKTGKNFYKNVIKFKELKELIKPIN